MAAILRTVCWRPGVLTAGLCLMLMAAGAAGAPGDLDPTFGVGGRVFINMDANAEAAASLVQQGDGKLLVGRATNFIVATNVDLSVVRLNPDGTPDTGFGVGGMASVNLPGITASTQVVVLQGPDKIIVAGPAWKDDDPHRAFFAIARYLANGSLDVTFGGGGYVLESFGAASASLGALVVQPDGRIVITGSAHTANGSDMAFARFSANGSIDTAFGVSGRAIVDVEGEGLPDDAYELVSSADGRLIAAGWAQKVDNSQHPILLSLTANGRVDSSFGAGGRVIPDIADKRWLYLPRLRMQSDGKIVVAGVALHAAGIILPGEPVCEMLVMRLDTGGQLDSTFGKAGVATSNLRKCYSPMDVIVAPDDRILFAGAIEYDGPWGDTGTFCPCALDVVRLSANGERDSSFGGNGEASIDLGIDDKSSNVVPSFDAGPYLLLQTEGSIAIAVTGEYDEEFSLADGKRWAHSGIAVARLVERGVSPGLLGFSGPVASVKESKLSTELHVQRTGGTAGVVSVDFTTSDDTAHDGQDYTRTSGTLTWVDGDSADKTITVAITDDAIFENLERVSVTLSNPKGGATLATSRSGVVIDDYEDMLAPTVASPGATVPRGYSSGGGGAVNWVQLLALALVLVTTKRRVRFARFAL